ncbi:hypothetical protein [Enhygromyxa salina]|uniref:Uncharacterized protein n=1 Tax=Enhygromyxa salina TaxID=215803 RepID=A0A2S9YTF3_9BACT|nr:hypothetical protein [Enhygromyxa salina]PRQ08319.1 hypothetical protein ENSA7_19460 [Enhygromyxa salina]
MHDPDRPRVLVGLPPIRSALTAPFAVARRDLQEVVSRPGPFVGGVLGSLLGCLALTGALLWMPSSAAADDQDALLVVEFMPASVVASGEPDAEPAAAAEPASELPADAPEQVSDEPGASVSEDAHQPSSEADPGATEAGEVPPTPTPKPKPTPTPGPAPGQDVDDPFHDANAWSDLLADGDPWASEVMRALRSMKVPAWAGQVSSSNPYTFRLRICTDGSVDKVLRKASSGDANLDAALEHELTRLDLPPVPPAMAAAMGKRCAVLDYNFAWLPSGVR